MSEDATMKPDSPDKLTPEQALIVYISLALMGNGTIEPQFLRDLAVKAVQSSNGKDAELDRLRAERDELQQKLTEWNALSATTTVEYWIKQNEMKLKRIVKLEAERDALLQRVADLRADRDDLLADCLAENMYYEYRSRSAVDEPSK